MGILVLVVDMGYKGMFQFVPAERLAVSAEKNKIERPDLLFRDGILKKSRKKEKEM